MQAKTVAANQCQPGADGDMCQEQHAKAAQPDEDDWLLDQ